MKGYNDILARCATVTKLPLHDLIAIPDVCWRETIGALFMVLALTGCARGTEGRAGAQYAPCRRRTAGSGPSTAEGTAVVAAVCSGRVDGNPPQSPIHLDAEVAASFMVSWLRHLTLGRENGLCPPPHRDPCRRRGRLLAPDGSG